MTTQPWSRMWKPWVLLILIVSVATTFFLPRILERRADARAIGAVYQDYEAACRARDVSSVIALTGPETRAWALQMYRAAAAEDAPQVRARPFQEQISILNLRRRFRRQELLQATEAEALHALVVDLARPSPQPLEVLRVHVRGDRATATLGQRLNDGTEAEAAHDVVFTRSSDGWRVNPHSVEGGVLNFVAGTLSQTEFEHALADNWREEYRVPFDPALWNGPRD